VGIRLREGDDFPYYVANGFSEEFLLVERLLCVRDPAGALVRDVQGNPVLECMCGNILCGRTDPTPPFFTAGGSFWTNCTTTLLASTIGQDRQGCTRNRCNSEGYESVALIPLRSGGEIIGLLQLNDRRPNRFTEESIRSFEGLGASIGVALLRKRGEEALRHAHERIRCFVDANLIGVVIVSPAGGVIEANDYYLRVIGYSREECAQGQIDWRAITPPEWLSADEYAIGELRERGRCTPYEKEYVRRDGSRVSVFLSNAMLPGPEEQIAAFVLDITNRKRLEQERLHLEGQLHQLQKLEAIGTLASGVAHEINNPINGIMNYAQLLADTAAPESRAAEYAGEILAEAARVATIVRNLLQFARQEKQAHSLAWPGPRTSSSRRCRSSGRSSGATRSRSRWTCRKASPSSSAGASRSSRCS
jgi:PAS domain S-box-containing protein